MTDVNMRGGLRRVHVCTADGIDPQDLYDDILTRLQVGVIARETVEEIAAALVTLIRKITEETP